MADLSSAIQKIKRAKVHIREAQVVLQNLIDTNLYTLIEEDDRQGWRVIKIATLVQPPPRLSLAIGDAAHCLRASLDHLAFAFAKPIPGKENREVQFPICSTTLKFREQRRRLKNVNRLARARIERFQPYHRRLHPEAKCLSTLREIDDMDKHRLLPFTEILVKRVTLDPTSPVKRFRGNRGRMKVGAVLARYQPCDGATDSKVKVDMVVIPIFGAGTPAELEGESPQDNLWYRVAGSRRV